MTEDRAKPETAQKLALIEAVFGYALPRQAFRNADLAKVLGIAPETMSRKRNDKMAMTQSDWVRLTHHFDLSAKGIDARLLMGTVGDVERVFQEKQLGVHGKATLDQMRQALLDFATSQGDGLDRGQVTVKRHRAARRGGIGNFDTEAVVPSFDPKDQVRIHLTCPSAGFVILLNDGLGSDITCLMPSSFVPNGQVETTNIVVPDTPDCDHFPVGGPNGDYRLFAIWFAEKPALGFLTKCGETVVGLDGPDIVALVDAIKTALAQKMGVMVASQDYYVTRA